MALSVDEIKAYVSEVLEQAQVFGIYLFWLEIAEGRDELCAALDPVLRPLGVVPIALRSSLLRDPNAWSQDAVQLISENRSSFEGFGDLIAEGRSAGVLVLAKTKLPVAQSSSPALLPGWFPSHGGRQVAAFARDVVASAGCPLNAQVLCIEDLCQLLYGLEHIMCKRFETILAANKHHGLPLWDSFLRERSGFGNRGEFLVAWQVGVANVRDARSFRPSLTAGWSLVAALWASFLDTRPSALTAQGERFADFLGLEDTMRPFVREPLLPVLFRSANERAVTERARLGRGMIVLVGAACQLSTAAAHADQYGLVRAATAASLSIDLRDAFSRLVNVLRVAA